jgi:phosphoribosylanthranilate isomerase
MFIKVCGITSEQDALLALALGAHALGFVFAPGSPRQVSVEQARTIVNRLPRGEVITVGVFRDEQRQRVVEVVNGVGLKAAQLHGREPLSEVEYVRKRVPLVIQGFAAGDPGIANAADGPADVILVDASEPGAGRVFDWSLAEGLSGGLRLLLAGGLTPENVGDAIRQVQPWGVDVSSGVETSPGSGRKDARKLRRFIEATRAAADALRHDAHATPPAPTDAPAPYDWESDEP